MAPSGDGARGFSAVVVPAPKTSAFPPPPSSASASALGSLSPWDYYPGAIHNPEKPGLGLRPWAGASFHRERVKPADIGDYGHYRQSGQTWQLGLDYDFTMNTIVKASLEISRQRIDSLYPGDGRRSDLTVRTVSLGGDWLLGERFLFSGRVFHGWVNTESSGDVFLRRPIDMAGNYFEEFAAWREEGGHSTLYGFSAKLAWPLAYGQSFKLLPEIGLEFARVRSPIRSAELSVNGLRLVRRDLPRKSHSLVIPATVRARRDYLKSWGLLSPHLDLGLVFEFGKSKNAAKAFNAGSVLAMEMDEFGLSASLRNRSSASVGAVSGLGLDAFWNNGWEARANFSLRWSNSQYRNEFRLEVGKCF
ncbi:MAG: autotransporter outer membrane beta-barrel domain-containing protein [Planctomycetota bacterium]|nr:autotransporter outer membrane beta-barrel domain-containing protein [Planctomycetota bacterium]